MRGDEAGVIGSLYEPDMAIDLGTANTLVFVKGHGIVLSESSVVAVNKKTGEVVAVGSAAKNAIGHAPDHVVATRPLEDGVIVDFKATEEMLSHFFRWARRARRAQRYLVRSRVAVCVPSGATAVELKAVKKVIESASIAASPRLLVVARGREEARWIGERRASNAPRS